MAKDKNSRWSLLSRLRSAVKKVTVLMNLNLTRFRLASMITNASSGGLSRRRIQSSNYDRRRRPGLTAVAHDEYGYTNNYYNHNNQHHHKENYEQSPAPAPAPAPAYNYEATPPRRSYSLQRTTSFPEEDDVDKRADMFIENFYRQLRMQRQVSLELRYKRSDASFGETNSSTPPTYASPSP